MGRNIKVASIIRSLQVHDLEVLRYLDFSSTRSTSELISTQSLSFASFAFDNTCHVLNENYKLLFPQEYLSCLH